MQVKEIIEMLKKDYKPNDSLVIGWWDYEEFKDDIKEELWDDVVWDVCDKLDYPNGQIHEIIYETLLEVKAENKE
tara:strand:+ start:613 stop:837 length:225 start_codon:yes stop_codon:yes gene_type:complete